MMATMTTGTAAWHENEAFWDSWAPVGFDAVRLEEAAEQVEQIVARLEIEPPAAVLDLCCGVGRHSVELARRGFRVTGVDRNANFLGRAGQRAAAENLSIEFVQSDMRRFRRVRAFDAAISYFTSFGYFDDDAQERMVVENLFQSLRPGGRLLMELVGKEAIARMFQPYGWEERGGVILCSNRKVVDDWKAIETRWIFLDGHGRREFTCRNRCYSAMELSALLASCGFIELRAYGDIAGAPYDHEAKRLVVTAQRPAQ